MSARLLTRQWAPLRVWAWVALGLVSSTVRAEQGAASLHLGLNANPVELPSLWRVTLGFVVCAGLIVAATWALRRYGGRLPWSAVERDGVRVRARSTPAAGLRVTVIEVDARRFLIAENRHALQIVPLDDARMTGVPPAGDR